MYIFVTYQDKFICILDFPYIIILNFQFIWREINTRNYKMFIIFQFFVKMFA